MALKGEGPKKRLDRVEGLLKDLREGKPVPRKRLERELEVYLFLLQVLWVWQFKK